MGSLQRRVERQAHHHRVLAPAAVGRVVAAPRADDPKAVAQVKRDARALLWRTSSQSCRLPDERACGAKRVEQKAAVAAALVRWRDGQVQQMQFVDAGMATK